MEDNLASAPENPSLGASIDWGGAEALDPAAGTQDY